nr:LytTR family DNA-binding domain-containing protein [uncultured Acetatifactor sp.]
MLIYICEDQESDLLMLKHHLNAFASEKLFQYDLMSFSTGDELLDTYKLAVCKPSLLFLDIYMDGRNGMETAKQLRDMGYAGGIIFTTASTEHAMDSYEVNALYYLQKPYDHNHFVNAMARCVDLIRQAQQNFTFMVRQKQFTVPYTDIVFFETGRHTVILHTLSDAITFSESLSNIIDVFRDTDSFLPVGRSYLINLNQVACSHNGDLLMADGSVVQIPVKKRSEILAFIEERKKK